MLGLYGLIVILLVGAVLTTLLPSVTAGFIKKAGAEGMNTHSNV